MTEGTQRRLAAIVSADVVGYSRLMGADEAGTHARLKARYADLIAPMIAAHGGRVVKLMGDGLLAEFLSVIDAVSWAVESQKKVAEISSEDRDDQIIEYRVGVNLGDVIVDGDDIFGDGVNIAARLQEMAEPGGVCISAKVHSEVTGKLGAEFTDGGAQRAKNIAQPVHIWHWSPHGEAPIAAPDMEQDAPLPLPDKPSIAVLPFDNMSGDPEQEYFSDGMTEDIITALSRLRWLFVIARNSTFTYKGQAVDVKQVGREMGVRYVLEGSVRKAGQRIRVTAQLIEADSGNHIWAERYDRDLVDIFDLQDELTEAISAQVNAELASSERQQAHKKNTTDLDTWELYQRGMWHFYKYAKGHRTEARRLFRLVTERAPEFASAYAGLARIGCTEALFDSPHEKDALLEQAMRDAEIAVALDDRDGNSHLALGLACTFLGHPDRAIPALEKAIGINPSSATSYYGLGAALYWFGRAEEAITQLSRAIRFSPHDPQLWIFYQLRGTSNSAMDQLDEAIVDGKAAIQAKSDEFWPHLSLAAALGRMGRDDEARAACARACKLNPDVSVAYVELIFSAWHPPYKEKYIDGLRKAGLPEE